MRFFFPVFQIWSILYLTVNWGQRLSWTWFKNANQWCLRTSWLGRFNPKVSGPWWRVWGSQFFTKTEGLWGRSHLPKRKSLNFSAKSAISQKLKIRKLIHHSFQHIAYLSRKFGHFWRIFFLVGDTLGNEAESLKIVNAIYHNSKNNNRKIDISFVAA